MLFEWYFKLNRENNIRTNWRRIYHIRSAYCRLGCGYERCVKEKHYSTTLRKQMLLQRHRASESILYLKGHRFDPVDCLEWVFTNSHVCCIMVLQGSSGLTYCTLLRIRTSAKCIMYVHSDWHMANNPHTRWGLPLLHLESLKNGVKSNNLRLLSRSVSNGEVTWLEVASFCV